MKQVGLVARREYLDNVRTKTFWIGILGFPVMLALMIGVPVLFAKAKDARPYAVVDESGWLLARIDDGARYEDAKRLLTDLRDAAKKEPSDVARYPEIIRSYAQAVTGATDAQIMAGAHALSGTPADDSREAEAPGSTGGAFTAEQAAAFRAWHDSLSPVVARSIDGSLSRAKFRRVPVTGSGAAAEADLRAKLDKGPNELFAYFVIGADPVAGSDGSKFVSNNRTDQDLRDWFTDLATDAAERERFAREGIAPGVAERIRKPLQFEEKQLAEGGEEKKVANTDRVRQIAPAIFTYVLWISVFASAQMLLTNTIEEKSNRVIEVLLSSISPIELMAGKILGIAATGVTVVGSWALFLVAAISVLPRMLGATPGLDLSSIARDPAFVLSFVGYYVLGYLLYAALLVSIGSVCNSLKEAQNLMQPVMILLVMPLLALVPVTQDPNGTLARVLSFVPPFTPFIMMNRAAGPPAAWEYIATTLVLMLSVALAFWFAAKIFRIGILMTGKPPRPTEILRWLWAPVTATPAAKE